MLLLILALNLQYSLLSAGIRNENHYTELGNLLFLHITFDLSVYTNRQTYTSTTGYITKILRSTSMGFGTVLALNSFSVETIPQTV